MQDAIARVQGLSPKQRLALRNELMRMTRDIGFIKCIHEQSLGPHGDAAAGVPMDQGRPLYRPGNSRVEPAPCITGEGEIESGRGQTAGHDPNAVVEF